MLWVGVVSANTRPGAAAEWARKLGSCGKEFCARDRFFFAEI